MKTKLKYFPFVIVSLLLFASCADEEVNHKTTLSDFNYLVADTSVNILSDSATLAKTVTLKWEESKAADYSTVFYDITFATTDDFSGPTYSLTPSNKGTENKVTLTYRDLNVIAERLGIKSKTTGSLKWKVSASNGINEAVNHDLRTITVSRPEGFASLPNEVFLLGTATSAGINIDSAIVMNKVKDKSKEKDKEIPGVFEVYTHLSAGNFYFILKEEDRNRQLAIRDTLLVEESAATSSPIDNGKMHHIILDFNRGTATITEVMEVGLWYSPMNDIYCVLTQPTAQSSVWSATTLFNAIKVGGISDYRYKFRIKEKKADGSIIYQFLGSEKATSALPGVSTLPAYYYLYGVDESQSGFCYKFASLYNTKTLKIDLDLQSSRANYTHSVTIIE